MPCRNSLGPPSWNATRSPTPAGKGWAHEIKHDGYRMHARIEGDRVQPLTRTGLDWSDRYRPTIAALGKLKVKSAYIDRELCALRLDGVS